MGVFPTFQEWMADRTLTEKAKAAVPDYSVDRWIKSAQQLGSQVDSFVGDAKKKEADADKELEKKKKEKLPVEQQPPQESKEKKSEKPEEEPRWNKKDKDILGRLKKIARERVKKK